jgi:anti-anti-sigma regulatory factor
VYEFRLLTVRFDGHTLHAVLPYTRLIGHWYREGLDEDLDRLPRFGASVVRLDLRSVEFIDGYFLRPLIILAKSLATVEAQLIVEVSPKMEEVLRITRLDRLFEVVGGAGEMHTADPA